MLLSQAAALVPHDDAEGAADLEKLEALAAGA
jgi:hypothetical protein